MTILQEPNTTKSTSSILETQVALNDVSLPSKTKLDAPLPISPGAELIAIDEAKLAAAKLKTATWDHYIGFFTLKFSGLTVVAAAVSELVDPTLIPIVFDPLYAAATGIALLTGKSMLGLVAKLTAPDNKEQK